MHLSCGLAMPPLLALHATTRIHALHVRAAPTAGNPSVLNSAKDVLRFVTFQRPPTVPHVILDGVNGVLKPGDCGLQGPACLGQPGPAGLLHRCCTCMQSGHCSAADPSVDSGCRSHRRRPHDAAAGATLWRQVGAAAGAEREAAVGAWPAGALGAEGIAWAAAASCSLCALCLTVPQPCFASEFAAPLQRGRGLHLCADQRQHQVQRHGAG